MQMDANLMTVDQAAEYLQLSRDTLYKYVQQSKVPAVKIGRHWRFSRDAVDAWIRGMQKTRPVAPVKVEDREAMDVLIVDDDASIRKLLSIWIGQEGHRIRMAGTGARAIELLQAGRFDVVLLDLHLPDMTGAEVLARVRDDRRPPVVLITGAPESKAMDAVLAYPLSYALSKPFHKDDVIKVLSFVRNATGATGVETSRAS
jgi:excisionase family DNA binding protein